MAFNHFWTCPAIDNGIREYKQEILNTVNEILDETCPLIEGEQKEKLVDDWADYLFQKLENVFEDVRETNRKIRSDAESQIEELEERVAELEKEINGLKKLTTNHL